MHNQTSFLLFLLHLVILYPNFSHPLESPCKCGRAGSGDCHSDDILQKVKDAFDAKFGDLIAGKTTYHSCFKYRLIGNNCSNVEVEFPDDSEDEEELLDAGGFSFFMGTQNVLTKYIAFFAHEFY